MRLFKWFKSMFVSTESSGYEEVDVRTKDTKGRFIADDPATVKNEAWTKKKVKKKVAKKKVAKKK
tara:strand:+ start:478 stop:672 length:195 start_codon:yes stop_codon:yes gene_type:complete